MKLLKILLVAMLLVSVVPFDGFCFEEGMDHAEQCATACHVVCCQSVIIPSDTSNQMMSDFSSYNVLSINHTHQSPHIAVEHRPPIVLS